jgi:uncharacterized protein
MSLYEETVPAFARMLGNVGTWLDSAERLAEQKRFAPEVLLSCRLAPDMFPLVRQFQIVCDTTKFTLARVTAKAPPSHADDETTFSQIRQRLAAATEYVMSFHESDFAGCEERMIALPRYPGQLIKAPNYVRQMQLPNFYFHAATAYAILRHNGVELGKSDFFGPIAFVPAPA